MRFFYEGICGGERGGDEYFDKVLMSFLKFKHGIE